MGFNRISWDLMRVLFWISWDFTGEIIMTAQKLGGSPQGS